MKKETLLVAGSTLAAATLLFAAGTTSTAHAATALGSSNTTGVVEFGQATIPPVQPPTTGGPDDPTTDPENPGTPTDPTDPTNPETPGIPDEPFTPVDPGTGLALSFAPNLNFGHHPVDYQKANDYSAYGLVYGVANSTGDATYTAGVPYLQVFDGRGLTNGTWSVTVEQSTQFTSSAGSLTGAKINFNKDGGDNVVTPAGSVAPDGVVGITSLTPTNEGGGAQVIFSADTAGTGTGINLLDFGKADGSTLVADQSTGASKTSPVDDGTGHQSWNTDNFLDSAKTLPGKLSPTVTLNVPAGSAKVAQYNTTLTWSLYDTPSSATLS
ncbi:WxL domain-containing protein [Lactococcus allomyrinae]|uniref:WxL domain-containing protein n=1 Tax=Lactococcus allomyrinae TaxID=2419773 RepID=A0A387BJ88_9LACT|nr:WxL domain-containing protein [Lactococcus allomyrinae]AYG01096.1 WxL domain-containing protein [Lactococcus allomyrinae]